MTRRLHRVRRGRKTAKELGGAFGRGITLDNFLEIREELSGMFRGREVDIVEKPLLKNPFRRHEILTTREIVYAALQTLAL